MSQARTGQLLIVLRLAHWANMRLVSAIVLTFSLLQVGCDISSKTPAPASNPVAVGELVITFKDYGPVPGPGEEYWAPEFISADQRHYAVPISDNDFEQFFFDGRPGRKYVQVRHRQYEGLALSPVGGRLAYIAIAGDNCVLVVDGKELTGYDKFLPPIFSRDGKHWACFAQRDNATFLLLDGKEISKFDRPEKPRTNTWKITFDADGDLNYTAFRNGRVILVLKGKEIPLPAGEVVHETTGDFSPDGRHFLYQASKGDNRFYVIDGLAGPLRPDDYLNLLDFSSDSRLFLYYAATQKGQDRSLYIVEIGPPRSEKVYDGSTSPIFRPDGSLWAFSTGNRPFQDHQLIIDDQVQEDDGSVGSVSFSPDSKHYAYTVFTGGPKAQSGGSMYIVRDGKRQQVFWRVDEPLFSPDGKHLAYIAQDVETEAAKWTGPSTPFVYVDGQNLAPPCQNVVYGQLAWSHDSNHVAFAIVTNDGEGRMLIRSCSGAIIRGKRNREYPLGVSPANIVGWSFYILLGPAFTFDSRHLIWVIQDQDKPALLIVDGRPVMTCDSIWKDTFRATPQGGFHLMVQRDKRVIFVEAK